MRKTKLLVIIVTAIFSTISCTPGERPRGSSSSETAMEDTIEMEYKSGKPDDSTNTKKGVEEDTVLSGD